MSRVKRGTKARARRKRLLKLAKGFRGTRKNCFGIAVSVVRRSLCYAYRDRRVKKREFRQLWIIRINAAARSLGLRYSELMHGLTKAGITLDRSILADLALNDMPSFQKVVLQAKTALGKAA